MAIVDSVRLPGSARPDLGKPDIREARLIRPDVADAPECAMTDGSAVIAKTALPAISRYFSPFPAIFLGLLNFDRPRKFR
jgi:hypothetical protein